MQYLGHNHTKKKIFFSLNCTGWPLFYLAILDWPALKKILMLNFLN